MITIYHEIAPFLIFGCAWLMMYFTLKALDKDHENAQYHKEQSNDDFYQ